MEIWIATGNKGKLDEFKHILAPTQLEVHAASELSVYSSPPETGDTFEANARIKAKALRSIKNDCWVIADDSGLEVAGLNNLPGVHSARYAGPNASDAENTAKLLKMISLRSAQKREAQFRSVLVAYSPEGKEFVIDGTLTGTISKQQRGTNGFGYDSVFIPKDSEKTFAEMTPADKNKISHRSVALRKFLELF